MRKKYILILYFITIILFLGVLGIGIYKLNLYLKNENLLIYSTGTNEKAFLNSTWKMSPKEIERANKTNLSYSYSDNDFLIKKFSGFPMILNMNRYSKYIQKDVLLWGESDIYVSYHFFDNMLFEYHINLENYSFEQIPSDIILTLRSKFGNEKKATKKPRMAGIAGLDELKITQNITFADLENIREEDKSTLQKLDANRPKSVEITGKDINIKREKYPYSFEYVWETQNQFITLSKYKNELYCLELGYDSYDNCNYYNILISAKYKNLYKEIQRFVDKERESYF